MKRSIACLSLFFCSAPLLAQDATTRPADAATPAGRMLNDGTFNTAGRMIAAAPNGPWDTIDTDRPEPTMMYASCMLQIDGVRDTDGSTIDANAISGLLTTTLLREAAAAKALGFSREETIKFVSIRTQPAGERFVRLYAGLRKNLGRDFAPDAPQQLLWAMCDGLRQSLDQSNKAKADLAAKAAADREDKRKKLQAEIDDLNKQIAAATSAAGEFGGSADNVQYQISNLQQQRRNTNQELTRLKRQLGDADPANASGLISQWQTLADARQKELNDLLAQQPVDADKVRAATTKLSDALAAVASAKANSESTTARRNGYDVSSLKSQIAESEQRLADYDAQLKKLQDPKMMELLNNLPTLQSRRNELRNQQSNFSYNSGVRPSGGGWVQITVLGATTQPVVSPTSQPGAGD